MRRINELSSKEELEAIEKILKNEKSYFDRLNKFYPRNILVIGRALAKEAVRQMNKEGV